MLGVLPGNYAGLYGVNLNPAGMGVSKLYLDFNLLSVNSSFTNNYAFIDGGDYLDFIFNGTVPKYYTAEHEERNYTIYRDNENYRGGFQNWIMGPGAMLVDGKHSYGITTGFKTNISFHQLPNDMGIFLYEAIDYDPQHNITYSHQKKIQTGSMAWFELGLSYAYNFKRYKWDSWSFGITVKPLFGTMGTFINIDQLTYRVHNDDSATVYNATFDYGFAIPIDYETNAFPKNPVIKGFGWGVDLGIVYARTTKGHSTRYYTRLCEQPYEEYNYKIGVSILDLGYIKFTKDAEINYFINTSTEWFRPYDTLPENSVNDLNDKVSSYFTDNAETVKQESKFNLNTPPALSIQGDYAINKLYYINATLIWGFNLGKTFLKRTSIVAITPRIETARYEISIPISVYEWEFGKPGIGLALRYGNFFVGTDRLNSLFGLTDFNEFSGYAGLRLNLSNTFRMNFIKGNCGNLKQRNIEMFDFRNF